MSEGRRPARATGPVVHRPIAGHRHRHDAWCGHAQVPHGDHADHLHDGELHHPCGDHVEVAPHAAAAGHLRHEAHMHVHDPVCGHEPFEHGDHTDFRHGAHRHAAHGTHYDEH